MRGEVMVAPRGRARAEILERSEAPWARGVEKALDEALRAKRGMPAGLKASAAHARHTSKRQTFITEEFDMPGAENLEIEKHLFRH